MAFANAQPDGSDSFDDPVDWSWLNGFGDQFGDAMEGYANHQMAAMTGSPMRSNAVPTLNNSNNDPTYPSPPQRNAPVPSPYPQRLPYDTSNSPRRTYAFVASLAAQNARAAQASWNANRSAAEEVVQAGQPQITQRNYPPGFQQQQHDDYQQRRRQQDPEGQLSPSQFNRVAPQVQQQNGRQQHPHQQPQQYPHPQTRQQQGQQYYYHQQLLQQQFVQQQQAQLQQQQRGQAQQQPPSTHNALDNNQQTWAQVLSSPPQHYAQTVPPTRDQPLYQHQQHHTGYPNEVQRNQGRPNWPTLSPQPPQATPLAQPNPNGFTNNMNYYGGMNEGVRSVPEWAAQGRVPLAPQDRPTPSVGMTPSNMGAQPSVQSPSSASVISSRGRRTKEELTSGNHAYRCSVAGCGYGFDTSSDLEHHLRYHREKPWICSSCGSRWTHEKDLTRHYNSKHNENGRIIDCPVAGCPYQSSRRDHMKRHIVNRHHGDQHAIDSVMQSSQSSSSRNNQ